MSDTKKTDEQTVLGPTEIVGSYQAAGKREVEARAETKKTHAFGSLVLMIVFAVIGVTLMAYDLFGPQARRSREQQASVAGISQRVVPIPQCSPMALPQGNYGIIPHLPVGDWCFHVGTGQTLQVKTIALAIEYVADVPVRLNVYDPSGRHVREATIGARDCISITEDWGRITFTPVDTGGTVRVRVGKHQNYLVPAGCSS
jgi:hypothetical protein